MHYTVIFSPPLQNIFLHSFVWFFLFIPWINFHKTCFNPVHFVSIILLSTKFDVVTMRSIIYPVHGRNVEVPAEYAHLVCMKRRDDLAREYGISERDLRTFLREHSISIPNKQLLKIEDVLEI